METMVENRRQERTDLNWPVSVWMPECNRFFNGISANISKSGVLMNMPIATPVKVGNIVELNFPRTKSLAEEKGSYSRIKSGKVVRIDRNNVVVDAKVEVAVVFDS